MGRVKTRRFGLSKTAAPASQARRTQGRTNYVMYNGGKRAYVSIDVLETWFLTLLIEMG